MADERCTPHGPTLAEMVAELRRLFPGGPIGSPSAHLLIGALAEIDRRLTALEELRHLPTCGTAYRGCDPACPFDAKWRAEDAHG